MREYHPRFQPSDSTGQRRHVPIKPKGARVRLPAAHAALVENRTIFPSTVEHASLAPRILVSGMNSRKTGRQVTKGKWAGMPIYTLTLEERATCPATCREWSTCYGNNMHFARRIIADEVFEARLSAELENLNTLHPKGFVVRLHILGDFYSTEYVDLWRRALDELPALRVFGYTARLLSDPIGQLLFRLAAMRWDRFAMRFSGVGMQTMASEVVDTPDQAIGILCPAQANEKLSCATCALCWSTERTISFLRH